MPSHIVKYQIGEVSHRVAMGELRGRISISGLLVAGPNVTT